MHGLFTYEELRKLYWVMMDDITPQVVKDDTFRIAITEYEKKGGSTEGLYLMYTKWVEAWNKKVYPDIYKGDIYPSFYQGGAPEKEASTFRSSVYGHFMYLEKLQELGKIKLPKDGERKKWIELDIKEGGKTKTHMSLYNASIVRDKIYDTKRTMYYKDLEYCNMLLSKKVSKK